jgi:tRNA(Ile2) C34 agmatinyltransferase TiaS
MEIFKCPSCGGSDVEKTDAGYECAHCGANFPERPAKGSADGKAQVGRDETPVASKIEDLLKD